MTNRAPFGDEESSSRAGSSSSPPSAAPGVALQREARRLLAAKAYDEAVRKLELHRPPEWEAVDAGAARLIRLLALAYLGQRNYSAARDCLEHLRALQNEKALLPRNDHAAALSDLCKCYRALQMPEPARQCQEEARRLLQSDE